MFLRGWLHRHLVSNWYVLSAFAVNLLCTARPVGMYVAVAFIGPALYEFRSMVSVGSVGSGQCCQSLISDRFRCVLFILLLVLMCLVQIVVDFNNKG